MNRHLSGHGAVNGDFPDAAVRVLISYETGNLVPSASDSVKGAETPSAFLVSAFMLISAGCPAP